MAQYEYLGIVYEVKGYREAEEHIKKVSDSLKNSGKAATESANAFDKSVKRFKEGGKDMQRVFSALTGTAIGAGIGGMGAIGFGAIGKMASLPVFQMKAYTEAIGGQMKGLQAAMAGFGAGGAGGALAGGSLGGMLGGALGSVLMPGVGTVLGGALGGLGGAALGGAAGGGIGMIGSMFAEATAKAEPFMQALLNMSTALQPLMDALTNFANTLAPAFEACYPAILGLSNMMAGFANMIAGPVAGVITQFANIFAVAFGIIGNDTVSTGTKIVDIFFLAVRGIATLLDTVAIPIWNTFMDIIANITGSVMGSIANAIANGLIDAVKGAMVLINGVVAGNPLAKLFGFTGFDVSGLNHVDMSGAMNAAMGGIMNRYKAPEGAFNSILDSFGVSSIGDLAAKYGVNLDARGKADLATAVKDLATKIDQKDMASKMTIEINVHQSFNGPVTQADLDKANTGVYDSVAKSLKASGVAV